jgi:catechol 2,3-dioxygenase-like lactoylglutathione lyase family enzyme
MLGTTNAIPTIAVKNLDTARSFYHDTLGLKEARSEDGEVIVFTSRDSLINVYRSQFAGTNKATAVTWAVKDVEAEVRDLKAKGVRFEHYDMPGLKREGDIHVAGSMKVAWFKDSDGNILNIYNQ